MGPSTYCLSVLRSGNGDPADRQLQLWSEGDDRTTAFAPLVETYRGGKGDLFHDWFPYLEGYSPAFVEAILDQYAPVAKRVLDPFNGVGTTGLACGRRGIEVGYVEVNPVLQYVAQTKSIASSATSEARDVIAEQLSDVLRGAIDSIAESVPDTALAAAYNRAFGTSQFFGEAAFDTVCRARTWIDTVASERPEVSPFLTVAALASLLPASKLIRRGDVRYRKGKELDAILAFEQGLQAAGYAIAADISGLRETIAPAHLLVEDARHLERIPSQSFDAVITSPPYLNGTNYFRNTKLELWFMRCLQDRTELAAYRKRAVTAGINDVSAGKGRGTASPRIESLVAELESNAYDTQESQGWSRRTSRTWRSWRRV